MVLDDPLADFLAIVSLFLEFFSKKAIIPLLLVISDL